MRKTCWLLVVWLCTTSAVLAQGEIQYIITANVNYYIPQNSDKQTYPILGYNGDADPKILVGGFGVGFTAIKDWKEKLSWKAQANISRRVYWDEPINLVDANNGQFGMYTAKSIDHVMGVTGTIQFHLGKRFSVGTGLGADVLLWSVSRLTYPFAEDQTIRNRYYKPIMPVLPLEASISLNKVLINIRYVQGLLNKFRSPLSDSDRDNYGVLAIEVGYRIH